MKGLIDILRWLTPLCINGEIKLSCTSNTKPACVRETNREVSAGYEQGDFDIQRSVNVPVVCLNDVIPTGARISPLEIDVQGYDLPPLVCQRGTPLRNFLPKPRANPVARPNPVT